MNEKEKDRYYIKFENINVLANFLCMYPHELSHYFSLEFDDLYIKFKKEYVELTYSGFNKAGVELDFYEVTYISECNLYKLTYVYVIGDKGSIFLELETMRLYRYGNSIYFDNDCEIIYDIEDVELELDDISANEILDKIKSYEFYI